MVLTSADLQEWESDPETFFNEQDAVQWKEKLRPCSEALFLLLFENYKEVNWNSGMAWYTGEVYKLLKKDIINVRCFVTMTHRGPLSLSGIP